jgi:hypothetical protein
MKKRYDLTDIHYNSGDLTGWDIIIEGSFPELNQDTGFLICDLNRVHFKDSGASDQAEFIKET